MLTVFGQGRITKDLELKNVNDNFSVVEFSIACDDRQVKDKEKTTSFFDVKAFNHTAKFICKYLKKGDGFMFLATPKQEKWQDENGNNKSKVVYLIDRVEFPLGNKKSESGQGSENTEEIPF